MKQTLKIAVLGDGGWGTTLAILLSKKGHKVTLWGAFPAYIKYLNRKRVNKKFLPGIEIPRNIILTYMIKEATVEKDLIVLAVPSQYIRGVIGRLSAGTGKEIYLNVAKGIENNTLLRMSELVEEQLGKVDFAVLSGPTISYEVAREVPSSAVVASKKEGTAKRVQEVFTTDTFRLYRCADVIGVEVGGALKNIVAIAAGISDGLGLGANSKAALLTRGLAEITRLGVAMGARTETFYGLSGLGDLVTTCISAHGRNRWFGEQIGCGCPPRAVLKNTEMAIEGMPTTRSAYELAKRYRVEMPITEQVYKILYKGKSPAVAVKELMLRPMKRE